MARTKQDCTPAPSLHTSSGALFITRVPVAADQTLIGQALLDAGALTVAGDYECGVGTLGMATLEVVLMPSTVTGVFAPSLIRLGDNGRATRATGTGASNFANATSQTLTLTNIRGTKNAAVRFTIPGGGAITFAEGADPLNPTALAEFNGQ